jgi:hypothetical protein
MNDGTYQIWDEQEHILRIGLSCSQIQSEGGIDDVYVLGDATAAFVDFIESRVIHYINRLQTVYEVVIRQARCRDTATDGTAVPYSARRSKCQRVCVMRHTAFCRAVTLNRDSGSLAPHLPGPYMT